MRVTVSDEEPRVSLTGAASVKVSVNGISHGLGNATGLVYVINGARLGANINQWVSAPLREVLEKLSEPTRVCVLDDIERRAVAAVERVYDK